MVSYNPATGAGEWHVQVPTLTASANTVLYVAYGDATITSDQSNPTAVWDSNYQAVLHFCKATALSVNDSTSKQANGVNNGATLVAVRLTAVRPEPWSLDHSQGTPEFKSYNTGFPSISGSSLCRWPGRTWRPPTTARPRCSSTSTLRSSSAGEPQAHSHPVTQTPRSPPSGFNRTSSGSSAATWMKSECPTSTGPHPLL